MGIDRSPTAMKIAENWLKDEGLNAVLQIAEPDSIPTDSESYDAVIFQRSRLLRFLVSEIL